MKKCKNCGANLEDDAAFCNECGAKVETSFKDLAKEAGASLGNVAQTAGKTISNTAKNYEASMARAANCSVVMSEDEQVIRTYSVTKVFFPRVSGSLLITNKRVIFYAGSVGSKVVMSTPINSIGTVSMNYGTSNILLVILGLIVGVYSIVSFTSRYGSKAPAVVALLLAAILIYFGLRKALLLVISASESSPAIAIGRLSFGKSHFSVDGVAGPDAEKAINEIGACILDLQQLGDGAISKWKE